MSDLKFVERVGWDHFAVLDWKTGDDFKDYHLQHFKISKHQYEEMCNEKDIGRLDRLCAPFKPTECGRCGCAYNGEKYGPGAESRPVYNTPDGTANRPGDMWYSESDHTYCGFQNCDKKHLMVRLPGGGVWDTDSRAINCDKPNDVIHRCWVKHTQDGIENMTIDKNGDTCNAGGGSFSQENWHGFIKKGYLIKA